MTFKSGETGELPGGLLVWGITAVAPIPSLGQELRSHKLKSGQKKKKKKAFEFYSSLT